jgi:hypothetical protein
MYRINYVRPEEMPPHQRDFPRREQLEEMPGTAGSQALALMVGWYIVAMFAGILLLAYLTAPRPPISATAASSSMVHR